LLFGNDVLRLFHGNDECLTIPENWNEYAHKFVFAEILLISLVFSIVLYEGGASVTQARSLWRIELSRTKWHGALVGFEQTFRIRHITTGCYLGIDERK
jgi:ryanodine receptor 2